MLIFGATSSGMGPVTIILIILMVVLMYFSMVRGPRKQQQQRQQMFNGLKKGDTIVTVGGLYGVIDSLDQKNNQVVLDSNGVFLTFAIQSISRVEKHGDATPVADATSDAADSAASSDAENRAASDTNDDTKED